MKFPGLDLGDLAGPEILSAVVEIREISCQASQQPIYCYDYLGNDWNESTATWNNVSPNSYSTLQSSKIISYANGLNQTVPHRYQFSILSAIRNWTESPALQVKGIMFKTSTAIENGSQDVSQTFASFNASVYQPSLAVTYASRTTTSIRTMAMQFRSSTNSRLFDIYTEKGLYKILLSHCILYNCI